ncbi:MAG: UDP-N-acetylmuramate--L-alanine ligase [Candidatus Zapsychrus exili]|nr:UDP-N-acetylmuramate--L-alanine ligase [Candidatus Zapsychrus exili]
MKHCHFIGIGGIGMGALAVLLIDKGYAVSGSDVRENSMIDKLKSKGAAIFIGHDAKNIEGADSVIFSSAIRDDNVELLEAKQRGIDIKQRAELLADLMKDHIAITVAGAHGKTTTSSMISNLLIEADLKPTIAVGGIINQISSNARLGEGKYFVSEVDESDGSFLKFIPDFSIITNVDFEHVDYYKDFNSVLDAYRNFIDKTKDDGLIIAFGEDKNLMTLLKASGRTYKTYGFCNDCDVYANNIEFDNFSSSFNCVYEAEDLGRVVLRTPGRHNILNALACISLGLSLEIDFDTISSSFNSFSGVSRRFELIADIGGIKIVDDYGHHPTEIKETLKTANNLKQNKLIVVFQPHRYSRTKFLFDEFKTSFYDCDQLIVTDIYAASESSIDGITSEKLVDAIKENNPNATYLKKDDIIERLIDIAEEGDIVMTLGAGDITNISKEFVNRKKFLIKQEVVSS